MKYCIANMFDEMLVFLLNQPENLGRTWQQFCPTRAGGEQEEEQVPGQAALTVLSHVQVENKKKNRYPDKLP
jgi:hypothetical protein